MRLSPSGGELDVMLSARMYLTSSMVIESGFDMVYPCVPGLAWTALVVDLVCTLGPVVVKVASLSHGHSWIYLGGIASGEGGSWHQPVRFAHALPACDPVATALRCFVSIAWMMAKSKGRTRRG